MQIIFSTENIEQFFDQNTLKQNPNQTLQYGPPEFAAHCLRHLVNGSFQKQTVNRWDGMCCSCRRLAHPQHKEIVQENNGNRMREEGSH